MTTWRMRIARRKPKATNTRSQYVILIIFSLHQWLNERASALCYTFTVMLYPCVRVRLHTGYIFRIKFPFNIRISCQESSEFITFNGSSVFVH
jgi:hypothetical protein